MVRLANRWLLLLCLASLACGCTSKPETHEPPNLFVGLVMIPSKGLGDVDNHLYGREHLNEPHIQFRTPCVVLVGDTHLYVQLTAAWRYIEVKPDWREPETTINRVWKPLEFEDEPSYSPLFAYFAVPDLPSVEPGTKWPKDAPIWIGYPIHRSTLEASRAFYIACDLTCLSRDYKPVTRNYT